MPRAYKPKPFDPKPFTPGATITWEHRTSDDRIVVRTGIVWSLAQKFGPRNAVWVIPDEALPGDAYRALYVVIPATRKAPLPQGTPWSGDAWDPHPLKDSPGKRTYSAAVAGRYARERNALVSAAS